MWNDRASVEGIDLDALLDRIAARSAAPASGTTAALVAAMAAALCTKIARFSDDDGAAAQAEALRRRLTALAQEDAVAFEAALRTLDEPREDDPERRDWQLGRSLAAAAEVPLRIAEVCADVADLGADLALRCRPELQPDASGATMLAEAGARVCAHLVAVNLGATSTDARVRRAEWFAAAAGEAVARSGAG